MREFVDRIKGLAVIATGGGTFAEPLVLARPEGKSASREGKADGHGRDGESSWDRVLGGCGLEDRVIGMRLEGQPGPMREVGRHQSSSKILNGTRSTTVIQVHFHRQSRDIGDQSGRQRNPGRSGFFVSSCEDLYFLGWRFALPGLGLATQDDFVAVAHMAVLFASKARKLAMSPRIPGLADSIM
ncbi:hypothetical protein BGZ61DRAFT_523432 [Ilyonectria robusta]|uniref:uncharacterized protein n=1 Tax=Ilyonectria robusta TaxID=1079257 RepID=UPI001E8CA016|nr:uncharacterized protein BGZ61DRAFT_523432 [Ilyonectria robusta]KAH8659701.1 hypothetical protein BGZ61DRAFT_523432 [Ilyonectria robusta]